MRRNNLMVIMFLVLVNGLFVMNCSSVRHASHSQETDALFRAVRAGSPDAVMALLASPDVDVNAVDEHGKYTSDRGGALWTRQSSDTHPPIKPV